MKTRTTARGSGSASGRNYRSAHGIFVGVNSLGRSSGSEDDALAMANALDPLLADSVTLVPNRTRYALEPTRRNVLASLEDTAQRAAPGDLVIAYFAAVTEQLYDDLYLRPSDFDDDSFLATSISFRLASAVLGSTPGVKSLIIVDSCHSGAIGFDMSQYRSGSDSSLMVSCGPSEEAVETQTQDGRMGGLFTLSLLQALDEWKLGQDPSLAFTLIDWFDRAYTLTDEHPASAGRQNPVLLGTLSPNLTLRARRVSDLDLDHAR